MLVRQWARSPTASLLWTLLELGDSTSRNLEFAHRRDVFVSYGEETITEQNLLEIRRWHWPNTHVETFPRREEARNGADWEWHLIGRVLTLKMRVQAKRVQQDDRLRIKHRVASTGKQQRELLVRESQAAGMKPTYCIYCTEAQRTVWKPAVAIKGVGWFQTGCLLADARSVPSTTTDLSKIEHKCVPWHHLCMSRVVSGSPMRDGGRHRYRQLEGLDDDKTARWSAPSVDQLNGDRPEDFDPTGVSETNPSYLQSLESGSGYTPEVREREFARLSEQGIHRWVVIDVRHEPPFRYGEETFQQWGGF